MKNKMLMLLLLLILMIPFINVYALEDKVLSVTVGEVDVPIYNVDVSWEAMEFTYQEETNYIWNNTSHTYELGNSTYKWITTSNNVNIHNLSSNSIDVELAYKSINEDVTGAFNLDKLTIAPGVNTTFKLTLDGKLNPNNKDYIKVGTIELKIS